VINEKAFALFRHTAGMVETTTCLFNFSEEEASYIVPSIQPAIRQLDSKEGRWILSTTNCQSHPQKIEENQTLLLQPLSVVVYSSL
jgi:hypothetical protein